MNCFCIFQTSFCKMKNRKECIQDTEDQTHEDMEGKVCVCLDIEAYYSSSSCECLGFFSIALSISVLLVLKEVV